MLESQCPLLEYLDARSIARCTALGSFRAVFRACESLITIKMGFTDSSHRKIRDEAAGFERRELVSGE